MRVESKFLTADVKIVKVSLEGRVLVVEGLVKGFMPMTVRTSSADALEMLQAVTLPFREKLAARLPERLRAMVLPAPQPRGDGAGVRPA